MQTLKNFIREALIIESDGDANGENEAEIDPVAVISSDSGPRYAAIVASINQLLQEHAQNIESDVDAQLSKWSGGGPGSVITDADVIELRKTLAYLLERDYQDGLSYPYRTALFLTGYEKGIVTYHEIVEKSATWAAAAIAGPIKATLELTTSAPAGAEPDDATTIMAAGAGLLTVAGAGWLFKHLAAHYAADRGLGFVMKLPVVGEMWKSISAGRMQKVVEDPVKWAEILTQFRKGVVETSKSDLTTSIIRPLRAYRDGVMWRTFTRDYDIVSKGLVDSLQASSKKIKVSVLSGETGSATSKSIGTLEFDLNKLIDMNNSFSGKNTPEDFVEESIRLALQKCFSQGGYEAATKGSKADAASISSVDKIFETENPFTGLFKESNPELKDLAEFVDAVGNKKDEFKKFESLLVSKIQSLIDSSGNLPNDITFRPTSNVKELPDGFRISIANDSDAKNFVNEMIDSKTSLKKLINLFVPAVEQMTALGKASKAGRTVLIGLGTIASALATAGLVGAVAGGISEAVLGDKVDLLTATKLASDAKIRTDGVQSFNSILEQEPDIDIIKSNLPLTRLSADRFKSADTKLKRALAVEAGGDDDAVLLMSEALDDYKAALGDQSPTNEHVKSLIGSLIREFLYRK